jgi:hypothetical protein
MPEIERISAFETGARGPTVPGIRLHARDSIIVLINDAMKNCNRLSEPGDRYAPKRRIRSRFRTHPSGIMPYHLHAET